MDSASFAAMIAGLEQDGLTRPEIVRRTGLSKNTIWRFATATVRSPQYDTVMRVQKLRASVRPVEPKRD